MDEKKLPKMEFPEGTKPLEGLPVEHRVVVVQQTPPVLEEPRRVMIVNPLPPAEPLAKGPIRIVLRTPDETAPAPGDSRVSSDSDAEFYNPHMGKRTGS